MIDDAELVAMQATLQQLEPLEPAAVQRVLIWLAARLLTLQSEEHSTFSRSRASVAKRKSPTVLTSELVSALLRSA